MFLNQKCTISSIENEIKIEYAYVNQSVIWLSLWLIPVIETIILVFTVHFYLKISAIFLVFILFLLILFYQFNYECLSKEIIIIDTKGILIKKRICFVEYYVDSVKYEDYITSYVLKENKSCEWDPNIFSKEIAMKFKQNGNMILYPQIHPKESFAKYLNQKVKVERKK